MQFTVGKRVYMHLLSDFAACQGLEGLAEKHSSTYQK